MKIVDLRLDDMHGGVHLEIDADDGHVYRVLLERIGTWMPVKREQWLRRVWRDWKKCLGKFSPDFMSGARDQGTLEERKKLL